MDKDTTDYGGWLEALEQRAIEKGEDRVNNICRKAIGRAAKRLIEVEGKLDAAENRIREQTETINQLNEGIELWRARAGKAWNTRS